MEENMGDAITPEEEKQVQQVAPQEEIREERPKEKKPGAISRAFGALKRFLIECKRVLKITKKPDSTEFKTIVKISGIGLLAIGLIGFILHFIKELIM